MDLHPGRGRRAGSAQSLQEEAERSGQDFNKLIQDALRRKME